MGVVACAFKEVKLKAARMALEMPVINVLGFYRLASLLIESPKFMTPFGLSPSTLLRTGLSKPSRALRQANGDGVVIIYGRINMHGGRL